MRDTCRERRKPKTKKDCHRAGIPNVMPKCESKMKKRSLGQYSSLIVGKSPQC